MNRILTVARKELRALFQSEVALLFLAVFEGAALFLFFVWSRFFARGIADVRPLFEWLPLLLVLLTAAVTMRQWAEERKLGTLEVLMTLPVGTRDLVLGKFLAGLALVGVALGLTTPLPLMVWTLGPLDLGPVIGGYVGALLLGGLYLSIGLCVSSRTDNQVVSLMVTGVVGFLLYAVGTDTIASLFPDRMAEVMRGIGTSSRFVSIERGVLDLRDLVYYGAATAFFLVLNQHFLERGRIDEGSERGKARARSLLTLTVLVGANAALSVVWLAPVTAARIDLTEGGEYSVSSVTTSMLADLHEPLFIEGFFSERTHPLLAPLVPQIRDTLAEYEIAGKGQVKLRFADPNSDPDLEQELAEQYAIRSVPFQVEDATQQAVVNSFFHILVRYGDQYQTLSFDNLIEFSVSNGEPVVRLRNLEYDLTRAIKRVTQDFSSTASVLADLPEPVTLTLYATPGSLPPDFAEIPAVITKVAGEIVKVNPSKFTFTQVDPGSDKAKQEELYQQFGIRPLAVDLFATQTFYLDLVLTMGDQIERLSPRGGVQEADLKAGIEAALKRLAPGQLTTVGVLTEQPEAPPPNPQIPPQFQPPPPRPDYQAVQQILGETYQVQPIDPTTAEIPDTIDVLLVAKPGALSDETRFAVDQYLMRGGRIIALASPHKITIDRSGLGVGTQDKGFLDLLDAWGVTVESGFVLDEQNIPFPRPVQERRGGFTLQRIELTPYPFFIDVRQDAFDRGNPAVAGLASLSVPWASPIALHQKEGVEGTVIAHTSDKAWRYAGTDLEPPAGGTERKAEPLAALLTGKFPSYFADKPNPNFQGDGGDSTGRTVKESLSDARLAVVGSAEIASDLLIQLAQNPGGEAHRGNLQFLQNLIDWSTEDTELLGIRTAGAFARTLRPMGDEERYGWMLAQTVLAGMLILGVAAAARSARRSLQPFKLRKEVA